MHTSALRARRLGCIVRGKPATPASDNLRDTTTFKSFESHDVVVSSHVDVTTRFMYLQRRNAPAATGPTDLLSGSWRRWLAASVRNL